MLKSLPSAVRIPLKLLASAGFATVTILLCVLILAWSTFLVADYGLSATVYGVYSSWWFALLLLLLGVNVVAATMVKLPWRRSQTGFLVVHAGILVLLIGCWLSWEQGVEGQLGIAEGATSSTVMENTQHFKLQIVDVTGEKAKQTVEIPFQAGPFSWNDNANLDWFPWHLARRDQGTLYHKDGVKLEVLDYAADSEMVSVPELVLRTWSAGRRMKGAMEESAGEDRAEFTLSVRRMSSRGMMGGREFVMGSQHQLPTGELVTFNFVDSQAEVRAFLDDHPKAPLGPLGQIVLRVNPSSGHAPKGTPKDTPKDTSENDSKTADSKDADSKDADSKDADSKDADSKASVYRFSLEEMIEEGIVSIGETSLRVQVTQFVPARMQVRLAIYDKEKPGVRPRIVSLGAFQPSLDVQDPTGEVIGSFWFSASASAPALVSTPTSSSASISDTAPDVGPDVFLAALRKAAKDHPEVVRTPEMSSSMVNQLLVIADLPRVDLIQGPAAAAPTLPGSNSLTPTPTSTPTSIPASTSPISPQLFMREWDGKKVTFAGRFNPSAKKIEWFAGSRRSIRVRVVRFTPAETPGEMVRAFPFKKKALRSKQRAQVRLTVGETSETFWLADLSSDRSSQLKRTLVDGDKSVSVELRRDELELGFGVHLDDFSVEYSPGSPMPSRYSSQVDFVKLDSESGVEAGAGADKEADEVYEKDVLIEVNYPAEFRDPSDGRDYRFFQTSYHGPIRPGEPAFEQFVDGKQKRDTLYFSYFTVTYDPGRFWKYAGCFMIIFGIAIMYYMKAYFFRHFSSRMK